MRNEYPMAITHRVYWLGFLTREIYLICMRWFRTHFQLVCSTSRHWGARDVFVGREASALNMEARNVISKLAVWTKMRGPRLTANWNCSGLCAACRHAKRPESNGDARRPCLNMRCSKFGLFLWSSARNFLLLLCHFSGCVIWNCQAFRRIHVNEPLETIKCMSGEVWLWTVRGDLNTWVDEEYEVRWGRSGEKG